ncbi:MAG: hypothetical protein ACKOSQ_06195 [Planctomycetaceae bacterium]
MSRRPSRTVPWIACAVVAAVAAGARGEVERISTEPGSGITIEIEGWAGINTPATGRDTGLIPIDVTITNTGPAACVCAIRPEERFNWSGRLVVPSATLAVPAGDTARTTLFVAVETDRSTTLRVTGDCVPGGGDIVHIAGIQSAGSPVDPDVLRRRLVGQSREVVARRADRPGDVVALDMARAPTDWRSWSSFPGILMTADEWRGMSAAARKAAIDRVTLGGRLVVFARPADVGLPGLPPAGERACGAGSVAVLPWNGEVIEEQAFDRACAGVSDLVGLASHYQRHPGQMRGMAHALQDTAWEPGFQRLAGVFGRRSLPVGAILAFLAVFGLVAGPLNVMWLAGPGRRSRMFWTTPAISLAATAFLLGLMFLRDGVGGSGARRVLAVLDPERATMAVIQEQFSRTGVLLGSTFPIREPSWMHPLGDDAGSEALVEANGAMRTGDWFRSRSDQAFLLEAVRPSRARIEFVSSPGGDAPPTVVSSVEVPLRHVFVIDDAGGYWQAFDVGTGEKETLQPATAADYDTWFKTVVADAGPVRGRALEALRGRRGWTFAETDRAAPVAIATLGSIRWGDDLGVFACPSARGATP